MPVEVDAHAVFFPHDVMTRDTRATRVGHGVMEADEQ